MRFKPLALLAALILAGLDVAISANNENSLEALSHRAISADAAESAAARASLREQGQAGLDAFISAHADKLKSLSVDMSAPLPHLNEDLQRLTAALDSIAAQRDARASLLYWHTDLEEAKTAARAEGKPVLSLRLLGRLDEELSCANSRFFRLTLYSNRDVANYLREHFILHWKSERPVPKVTIDFGDGRKLERTVTGNSIHYVLDAQGRPIDALPGLYGPQTFLRLLAQAESAVKDYSSRSPKAREAFLRDYHAARLKEINGTVAASLARLEIAALPALSAPRDQSNPPTAEVAARRVVTKLVAERPLLRELSRNPRLLAPAPDDEAWARIGSLYYADTRLDANSLALIRSKNPEAFGPLGQSASRAFTRAITLLERSIAEDTARNEYLFHAAIHDWFARGVATSDMEKLNERIYAELFLTPRSDPWLGLLPANVYMGIEGEGIKK